MTHSVAANPQWRDDTAANAEASAIRKVDSVALLEKQVMDRIVAGDHAAMMILYDRYSRLVFSIAVHIIIDKQIAEDIVQEVFLRVWKNPGCFNSARGSLSSWLAVMTRHRAIDILRQRRRECAIDIDHPSDSNLLDQVEMSEAATKVAVLFPLMPVPQQVALGLAYFFGLSHSEISSRTGEPLGTVKSRIRLALEFLRKTLANPERLKFVPVDPTRRVKRK